MSDASIDLADLEKLVNRCIELEASDRAYRACVSHLARKLSETSDFQDAFGDAYEKELEHQKTQMKLRYAPLFQAIARGTPVGDALKNLARTL